MRHWIVLIGAPATGKTTLSKLLSEMLNAKLYSFDEIFPLDRLKHSNSKDCRKELLNLVRNDSTEYVIIDDSCHFNSIQKRYILESEKSEALDLKVIFIYISARADQIYILKARNGLRDGIVTSSDIDSICLKLGTANFFKKSNFIEYNIESVPRVDKVVSDIENTSKHYKLRSFEEKRTDEISDLNFYNRLNLALNKEISKYFQSNGSCDGKTLSMHKTAFISEIKNGIPEDADVDSLVNQFRIKFLFD